MAERVTTLWNHDLRRHPVRWTREVTNTRTGTTVCLLIFPTGLRDPALAWRWRADDAMGHPFDDGYASSLHGAIILADDAARRVWAEEVGDATP